MGHFEQIMENPALVILSVLLVIYAIKEGYELFNWWKARADGYHKIKSEKEDFHQQVNEIACTSKEHTEALGKIKDALEGINQRLDKTEEERREDTVANARVWLYRLYEELKDKPAITMNEYETFSDLANRYLAAGGNSVFKDKIIPEILAKPVDED